MSVPGRGRILPRVMDSVSALGALDRGFVVTRPATADRESRCFRTNDPCDGSLSGRISGDILRLERVARSAVNSRRVLPDLGHACEVFRGPPFQR